jgi:hypothetical protein
MPKRRARWDARLERCGRGCIGPGAAGGKDARGREVLRYERKSRAFGKFAGAGGGWAARRRITSKNNSSAEFRRHSRRRSRCSGRPRSASRRCRRNRAAVVDSRGAETGSGPGRGCGHAGRRCSCRRRRGRRELLSVAGSRGAAGVENAMVVRVQLPVSSLQLMGVPVDEERADERASRAVAGPGWPGARRAFGQ